MGSTLTVATLPTLYRSGDGYWRTVWHDSTGKRHRRSFGRNRTEARNLFGAWLERWRRDETIRNPQLARPLTIAAAVDRYIEHARHYYRNADGAETGERRNIEHATATLAQLFGERLACELTPLMLRAVRDAMLEHRDRRGHGGGRLSVGVINARIRRIRQAWKWLVSEHMVGAEVAWALSSLAPLKAGRTSAPVRAPVTAVSEEIVCATCEHLPPSIVAMVWTAWFTGARPAEICRMSTGEIDTAGELWEYRPRRHKMAHLGRERTIIIGPRAQTIIMPYLRRELEAPLWTPRMAHEERAAAKREAYQPREGQYDYRSMPSYQRRRQEAPEPTRFRPQWSPAAWARAIARATEEAIVPHWSPNQLRHAAATRARRAAGLDAAQAVMDHASADTTEIYAERDRDLAREVMRRIG